jgi:hypothetical protein
LRCFGVSVGLERLALLGVEHREPAVVRLVRYILALPERLLGSYLITFFLHIEKDLTNLTPDG